MAFTNTRSAVSARVVGSSRVVSSDQYGSSGCGTSKSPTTFTAAWSLWPRPSGSVESGTSWRVSPSFTPIAAAVSVDSATSRARLATPLGAVPGANTVWSSPVGGRPATYRI